MRQKVAFAVVMAIIMAALVVSCAIAAVFPEEASADGGVTLAAIFAGAIAAGAFALVGFFNAKLEEDETLDWVKLIVTALMGVFVGIVLTVTNIAVTEQNVAEAMLAYVGLTAILYKIVKGLLVHYGIIAKPVKPNPEQPG
jgi:drug/metabolite transporter (DMT)-like permease